jgi:hypothetical protein
MKFKKGDKVILKDKDENFSRILEFKKIYTVESNRGMFIVIKGHSFLHSRFILATPLDEILK